MFIHKNNLKFLLIKSFSVSYYHNFIPLSLFRSIDWPPVFNSWTVTVGDRIHKKHIIKQVRNVVVTHNP